MCKKLLSLLLALCVAVSLAVVPAAADTTDAGEAYTPTQSAGLSAPEGLGDGSAALQFTENGKKVRDRLHPRRRRNEDDHAAVL